MVAKVDQGIWGSALSEINSKFPIVLARSAQCDWHLDIFSGVIPVSDWSTMGEILG
jgi:hypothetical protein